MATSPRRARDRVYVTVTPRLAAILARHARPGEPRATTAARLIVLGDQVSETLDEPAAQPNDTTGA